MATITLDYNSRNAQARKALDYILSMGVFRTHQADSAVVQKKIKSAKRKRIDKMFDPYLVDMSAFKFNRDEANDYD
jgi:hypothetical protein